ncbi:MAG: flagellar basal body protein [Colwellia sp.]
MNINGLASSVSGLRASATRINVSGHNIANVNTDEFKSQVVNQTENRGIVETTITRDETKGPEVQHPTDNGTLEKVELSNVDISQEVGNQILASNNYKANAKAIQVQDEVMGTIIDLKK